MRPWRRSCGAGGAPAPPGHHHPIFARVFVCLSRGEEKYGVTDHRRELLAELAGRVLEVGAGSGLNFPHYPPGVDEVVAVEPEPHLRRRATESAREAPIPVKVVSGVAEKLPFADDEFDAVVVSLVLCSVADPGQALAEIRRVTKVGGKLHFYEHVAAEEPRLARLQRRLDHVWPFFAGGCHTNRETVTTIEQAGFTIERCRRFSFRPCFLAWPVSPQVIGVARNEKVSA